MTATLFHGTDMYMSVQTTTLFHGTDITVKPTLFHGTDITLTATLFHGTDITKQHSFMSQYMYSVP